MTLISWELVEVPFAQIAEKDFNVANLWEGSLESSTEEMQKRHAAPRVNVLGDCEIHTLGV